LDSRAYGSNRIKTVLVYNCGVKKMEELLFVENIKQTLELLENKNRFFRIESREKVWFYDSFSHGLYSINKTIWKELLKNGVEVFFQKINKEEREKAAGSLSRSLSLGDLAKFFGFFSTFYKCQTDLIAPLPVERKCTVMINTSNRCNLNCSYCYRNKNDVCMNNINTVKKTIEYAMKRYKPEASEYVISYSMTSESSVDLNLLKKIADEYINYENYQFSSSDFIDDNFNEFYKRLKEDLFDKLDDFCLKIEIPEQRKESVAVFLNKLLELRNLYDLLQVTDRMFNEDAKYQIQKRDICAKWKLFRINRWCLEVVYDNYLAKRHVPYVSFWFMSNGTCASPEFIEFIKSCDINPFWISIDGPQEVHDKNRSLNNKNGSYEKIVNNIDIFRKNGINLKASVVITADYPKVMDIITHLQSLGFTEASMTPVRPGYNCSFNEDNIERLLAGYDAIFSRLKLLSLKADFSLFRFLREDLTLAAFNIFLGRTKLVKRCDFDEQIVVNSKGEIYPCLYMVGNKDFCYGNIYRGIDRRKIRHDIHVNQRGACKDCWARYLCGGTCFYSSLVSTGNCMDIDPMECILKKHLAQRCLELIVFLKEHNISFEEIY